MKQIIISISVFLSIFVFCSFAHNPRNFVYEKERLKIIKDSVTLYGIITYIKGELDGDFHLRLKMNDSLNYLLSKNNFRFQDSCLVLEIVCGKSSFHSICNEYENSIDLPAVGDIVAVTGVYVFDKRHKWMELHPVLYMDKIIQ